MSNTNNQSMLFNKEPINKIPTFPSTRYQGSKVKIVDWIKHLTEELKFDSVLDAFGGTGSVGYMYKQLGKKVVFNDYLKSNYTVGKAIIENSYIKLNDHDISDLLLRHSSIKYPSFIQDTFHDIYYTDEENKWLDQTITNIKHLDNPYKKSLAYFALFQACIIKRPYNLFHRKNLYIRFANVSRSFGNKSTWDTPFELHFKKFIREANNAVFDNIKDNKASNLDVLDINSKESNLIYIDTPYVSQKGVGVNYFDFYHFLEGIMNYDKWHELIDTKYKHKKIKNDSSDWSNKNNIHLAFRKLFDKFKDSIIIVSYRSDGIPSIKEIASFLEEVGKKVKINELEYKYALSTNRAIKETLLIGQ